MFYTFLQPDVVCTLDISNDVRYFSRRFSPRVFSQVVTTRSARPQPVLSGPFGLLARPSRSARPPPLQLFVKRFVSRLCNPPPWLAALHLASLEIFKEVQSFILDTG